MLWRAGLLSGPEEEASLPVQAASVNVPTALPDGLSVGLSEGEVAPDFEFSSLSGDVDAPRLRLSQFRGRPVLVNFWASWCLPCRAEMPDVEAALQTYAPQQLVAVGVNNGERYRIARDFIDKVGARFTAFAYDADAAIARRYRVRGMPTTYFIDAQGVIRLVVEGQLTPSLLENGIKRATGAER